MNCFAGRFGRFTSKTQTYVLGYVSGELAGRYKRLQISKSQAEQLMAGAVSCDDVLLAHGAG